MHKYINTEPKGTPSDREWQQWAAALVSGLLANVRYLSRPLSHATLIADIIPTAFATGRIDDAQHIALTLSRAIKDGKIIEVNTALQEAWASSDYTRCAANDRLVYDEALLQASEGAVLLDDAEQLKEVINALGQQNSWMLNPRGQQEANQKYRETFDAQERASLIAELTSSGKHGFSVIEPVGNQKQGWTTKRVEYDSEGRELKIDLQGFSASGRIPRKDDQGFASLSTERIKEIVGLVRSQNQLRSQSTQELRKTAKDLRAGTAVSFGAELVAQQKQSNDDVLFRSENTGQEFTRDEIMWFAKNDLQKIRTLLKRDSDRLNRILKSK